MRSISVEIRVAHTKIKLCNKESINTVYTLLIKIVFYCIIIMVCIQHHFSSKHFTAVFPPFKWGLGHNGYSPKKQISHNTEHLIKWLKAMGENKILRLSKFGPQLPTWTELQNHVDVSTVLKCCIQPAKSKKIFYRPLHPHSEYTQLPLCKTRNLTLQD